MLGYENLSLVDQDQQARTLLGVDNLNYPCFKYKSLNVALKRFLGQRAEINYYAFIGDYASNKKRKLMIYPTIFKYDLFMADLCLKRSDDDLHLWKV